MTSKQAYLVFMGLATLAGMVTIVFNPDTFFIMLFYFVILFLINAWVLRGKE